MKTSAQRTTYWAPRVLAILFAIFISMFALDALSDGNSFGETMVALMIHLIPTACIVVFLAVAWRRSLVGAFLYAGLAGVFLLISRGEGWIVSGPLLGLSALFWLDSVQSSPAKRQLSHLGLRLGGDEGARTSDLLQCDCNFGRIRMPSASSKTGS